MNFSALDFKKNNYSNVFCYLSNLFPHNEIRRVLEQKVWIKWKLSRFQIGSWDAMLIVSSDPCQHTVCSRSSQLSMNSAYDYKGKGHFSCSERHPNELVTVYLTLPSSPLKQTFYFHCQQASWTGWGVFVLPFVSGTMTAKLKKNLFNARFQSKQLFIKKIIMPQRSRHKKQYLPSFHWLVH